MPSPPKPSSNQSVHHLRSFLTSLERVVRSTIDDYELTRQGGSRIIYLLDFSDIYYYIFPNIRTSHGKELSLFAHVVARDLFQNIEETIGFPLGTLAEISQFLRRLTQRIDTINRATISPDLVTSFENIIRTFQEDHLLMASTEGELSLSELNREDYLAAIQRTLLRLLQRYNIGLTDLYNLLRHERTIDLASLVRRNPFRVRAAQYRSILKNLSDQRKKSEEFANKADAYNLAFLIDINRNEQVFRFGRQSVLNLFRLLTSTSIIHQLDRGHNDLLLRFQLQTDNGHVFELLEEPKDVLTKRLLFHVAETDGIGVLREFLVQTVKARATLGKLSDILYNANISIEDLIGLLPEPNSIASDQLFQSIIRELMALSSYMRNYNSLTSQLIARETRHDLIPNPLGDERLEFPHLAGQSIASLRNLINSIESTMENFGHPKEMALFRDNASKAWSNPLLSLQHLGYRTLTEQRPYSRRWTLSRVDDGMEVLSIDTYRDTTIVSWPTQFPAHHLLKVVGHKIANTNSEAQHVHLEIIDWNGMERSLQLPALELPLPDQVLAGAIFLRVTFGSVSIATELFSFSQGYQLRTGIITMSLDPTLVTDLFFALTTYRLTFLLKRVLLRELVGLTTDLFDLGAREA